jgi:hypothetical protein
MNLFINDNFIDTVGTKPNVIQLIRQIAEDDEIVHGEVLEALREVLDYSSSDILEDDIQQDDVEDVAILDGTLYVEGQTLVDLFENLFPGDHTGVISALVVSIQNANGPTLRVDHNGVPAVDPIVEAVPGAQLDAFAPTLATAVAQDVRLGSGTQQSIADPVPEGHVITAIQNDTVTVRPVEPFQGNPAEEEVLRSEVAVLNTSTILGDLTFNGYPIRTLVAIGSNGVLFNLYDLYHSIYGLQTNPDYGQQLIRQNGASIGSHDLGVRGGAIFVSAHALAVLHPQIAPCIEWSPMIKRVVDHFNSNPYDKAAFDLLGDLVA